MSKMTLNTEGDRFVVVTRRFAASPEAVFRAHTDPALIQKWMLGPDGWTMPVCTCDPRPGGKMRYEWSNGNGQGFSLTGECLEIEPPRRIVHVERMHLPESHPRQPHRDRLRARRRRDAHDHAHDPARCADPYPDAGNRNGARDGAQLPAARRADLALPSPRPGHAILPPCAGSP